MTIIVGARIPNVFDIRMVKCSQILNDVQILNGIRNRMKMDAILSKKFGFQMVQILYRRTLCTMSVY